MKIHRHPLLYVCSFVFVLFIGLSSAAFVNAMHLQGASLPTAFVYLPFIAKAVHLQAMQNLTLDPWGRVIDVAFDQDLSLTAPWDRFRFDIDIVQPLARDSGAFLGDLNSDGVLDLVLASFTGERLFFPGIAGNPKLFGNGSYLKYATASSDIDPFRDSEQSALWVNGDIGDLDGNGKNEVVIGHFLYSNTGTPSEPKLKQEYEFPSDSIWDPAASIGDLNADGKPDVLITYNTYRTDTGGTWIYWNTSTPGSFSFTAQLLHRWPQYQTVDNMLSFGDLNGDGLLDLAGGDGIFFNYGTPQNFAFDFNNPSPWNVIDGGYWNPKEIQQLLLFFRDADSDGLLDAYISQTGIWQVLYYHNVGTATSPQFQYEGPIVAASTPLSVTKRGEDTNSFGSLRSFLSTADIDQNGLSDIWLSTDSDHASAILWNFPIEGDPFSNFPYPDRYTFPELAHVSYNEYECYELDALCNPRSIVSAWIDLTGDGLADNLTSFGYWLYRNDRSGSWPFTLKRYPDAPILTNPSGNQATGLGVALVDVDLDGYPDLVTGSEDGQLLYYRNTVASGSIAFSDAVPLADSSGIPFDVGNQSLLTAIDLNGDGCLDFLVANYEGFIRKIICTTPGSAQGYQLGDLLGTPEQNPVNVNHVFGGGIIAPSLATIDLNKDGLYDIVMGDANGRVWLLRNIGNPTSASFSLSPLIVSRTAAAYLEILDARHIRLYFALPTISGKTILSYHSIPTTGTPISGEEIIH